MQPQLRIDTAELRTMAGDWDGAAGELGAAASAGRVGLSCQASAAAVASAGEDIAAFTSALAARVRARVTRVTEADARYGATEAESSDRLAV